MFAARPAWRLARQMPGPRKLHPPPPESRRGKGEIAPDSGVAALASPERNDQNALRDAYGRRVVKGEDERAGPYIALLLDSWIFKFVFINFLKRECRESPFTFTLTDEGTRRRHVGWRLVPG